MLCAGLADIWADGGASSGDASLCTATALLLLGMSFLPAGVPTCVTAIGWGAHHDNPPCCKHSMTGSQQAWLPAHVAWRVLLVSLRAQGLLGALCMRQLASMPFPAPSHQTCACKNLLLLLAYHNTSALPVHASTA